MNNLDEDGGIRDKLKALDPVDLLRVLVLGEAESESLFGKFAVAQVVKNRMLDTRWPNNWREVMLQPKQFSCFNPGLFRAETLKTRRDKGYWKDARYASFGIFYNHVADMVAGSNHYHSKSVTPFWSRGHASIMTIGSHVFYRL